MTFFLTNLPVVCLLGLNLWMLVRMRRMKQRQDALVERFSATAAGRWYRISVSRVSAASSKLRMMPYESLGGLIDGPDAIRVVAELPSGELIDRTYRRADANLRWAPMARFGLHIPIWIMIGEGSSQLRIGGEVRQGLGPTQQSSADLYRQLMPGAASPSQAVPGEFALEKNRGSMGTMVAMALLAAYGVIDAIVNPAELLELGRARWGFLGVVVAVPAAIRMLVRLKVPRPESVGLAVLLGVALCFAYLPAAKRVDQWLSGGSRPFDYRLVSVGLGDVKGSGTVYASVEPGAPDIELQTNAGYWSQFKPGALHTFDLIHGPLGLWQLDPTRLQPLIEAYESDAGSARSVRPTP